MYNCQLKWSTLESNKLSHFLTSGQQVAREWRIYFAKLFIEPARAQRYSETLNIIQGQQVPDTLPRSQANSHAFRLFLVEICIMQEMHNRVIKLQVFKRQNAPIQLDKHCLFHVSRFLKIVIVVESTKIKKRVQISKEHPQLRAGKVSLYKGLPS